MNISIQKAKNGEDTALAENHFLHSNYAPSKEAERYVANLNIPFEPKVIVVCEPALSYIAEPLRKKYPDIKIGVIRYTDFFAKYNINFDFVINLFENINLENTLTRLFSEEILLSVYFAPWQASGIIFPEQDKYCWRSIKNALERAKTLLVTRQYFEKKWLINTANFLRYIQYPIYLNKIIEKPVLIISSGPSLKDSLKIIKFYRNTFFVIALSSALSPCLTNKIIPDLCITSDGGFWAGEHLKKLHQNKIFLSLPGEALCPKSILNKSKVLPLVYDDGISYELTKASGLKCLKAVRNGTISGTALLWAISNSSKEIYFTGLDMASQKGFQHTQPNELEINSSVKDSRINTKEKRLSISQFGGSSLEIYRKWFESFDFNITGKKIFRIINPGIKQNTLGSIIDLSISDFENQIKNLKVSENNDNYFVTQTLNEKPYFLAKKYFEENLTNEEWKKQLFPLDYVLLSHNPSNSEARHKIDCEYEKICKKILRILDD